MKLVDAFNVAAGVHAGQVDKAGAAYIEHPVRVMLRLPADATDAEKMAALLHDALEDGDPYTLQILKASGATAELLEMLDALTRGPVEPYCEYLLRVARSTAVRVKIADIQDNMDPQRLSQLPEELADKFRTKYARAIEIVNKEKA